MTNDVTVSVVSHNQVELVNKLLDDLAQHSNVARCIVTHNIPENAIEEPEKLKGKLVTIRNDAPLGFGANHNQAFKNCDTSFFCVINPDITFKQDPFQSLVEVAEHKSLALVTPRVIEPSGHIADHARRFPTPVTLITRIFGAKVDFWQISDESLLFPDWVAGMFLLFRSKDFASLGGFDERYFMYCEDIDICFRAWRAFKVVGVDTKQIAIHMAQKKSHRNLQHLRWHIMSILKFWYIHKFNNPRP